jgi:hypothetical protein
MIQKFQFLHYRKHQYVNSIYGNNWCIVSETYKQIWGDFEH